MNRSISPSRTYVAMVNKSNFNGYYFRKFTLPEGYTYNNDFVPLENNSGNASWFFLSKMNSTACIEGCFAVEDLGQAGDYIETELTMEDKRFKAQEKIKEEEKKAKELCVEIVAE